MQLLHNIRVLVLLPDSSPINSRGRVAKALACNARGDGFAPQLQRHFRDLFISRIDTVSGTEGLEMVRVALLVLDGVTTKEDHPRLRIAYLSYI